MLNKYPTPPWFDGVIFLCFLSRASQWFLLGVTSSVCCFYLCYLHFLSIAAACFKLSKFGHSKQKTWLSLIILQPLQSKALSTTVSPLSNKWQTCQFPPILFLIFLICYVSEKLKIPRTRFWSSLLHVAHLKVKGAHLICCLSSRDPVEAETEVIHSSHAAVSKYD